MPVAPLTSLADLLERELRAGYGSPLIGGEDLRRVLGYASREAMRQAISRGTIPVPVFDVPNRRGKFALTRDVSSWLAQLRLRAAQPNGSQQAHPESGSGNL
ncbi:hypothetical protein B2A_08594, partial [mine drainage metagenome]